MEQRTLAQLLRVVLVVVVLLELRLLDCHIPIAWVHIENPFSLSCT